MKPSRAVSVSAELLVIERAVQSVADRLDVSTLDHPVDDDVRRRAAAVLMLAALRLRDLGRAARGRFPVELLWSPHSGTDPSDDQEDLILYEPVPTGRKPRK